MIDEEKPKSLTFWVHFTLLMDLFNHLSQSMILRYIGVNQDMVNEHFMMYSKIFTKLNIDIQNHFSFDNSCLISSGDLV